MCGGGCMFVGVGAFLWGKDGVCRLSGKDGGDMVCVRESGGGGWGRGVLS